MPVQNKNSNNLFSSNNFFFFFLKLFLEQFKCMKSGHGPKHVECVTHDTKKALVQTTEGLIGVWKHLFSVGFDYILLYELQIDRIEGEFSVYRQSTGANAFIAAGDVFSVFIKFSSICCIVFRISGSRTTQ